MQQQTNGIYKIYRVWHIAHTYTVHILDYPSIHLPAYPRSNSPRIGVSNSTDPASGYARINGQRKCCGMLISKPRVRAPRCKVLQVNLQLRELAAARTTLAVSSSPAPPADNAEKNIPARACVARSRVDGWIAASTPFQGLSTRSAWPLGLRLVLCVTSTVWLSAPAPPPSIVPTPSSFSCSSSFNCSGKDPGSCVTARLFVTCSGTSLQVQFSLTACFNCCSIQTASRYVRASIRATSALIMVIRSCARHNSAIASASQCPAIPRRRTPQLRPWRNRHDKNHPNSHRRRHSPPGTCYGNGMPPPPSA